MPTVREIEIFKIAESAVDGDEVRRWMNYLGADPERVFADAEQSSASNEALLIALAAKRCYMSFEAGLNPNVTQVRSDYVKYFDNILASGHGCYDSDTDVLTTMGWKSFEDVTGKEQFATLDSRGRIQYVSARAVTHAPYKGRMYRVDSQHVDLLVTPNHNMFVCPTTTKIGRSRQFISYSLIRAEDLGHRSHAYTKVGDWKLDKEAVEVAEAELLGFAIGDGHSQDGKNLSFHLRRERKIIWLRSLAARLPPDYSFTGSGHNDRFYVNVPPRRKDLFAEIYSKIREKQIPEKFLLENSKNVLLGLLEGLSQSDGSRGWNDAWSYSTTSEILPGQIQQLALHCGIAANITSENIPNIETGGFGSKPVTRLQLLVRVQKPEVNKWSGCDGKTSWIEDWEGDVHCVSLPEDTLRVLYVRRNGIPVWCGNSVLEHASFSFAIEGVTRVFTAEMNRHRAGWAISEGSLRFIRFDKDIPYWMPDSIRGPEVLSPPGEGEIPRPDVCLSFVESEEDKLAVRKQLTRESFDRVFRFVEKEYGFLLSVWDMDETDKNFSYKKKVTSCLRRIVPLGVSSGGVWTGNVRALRHVLAMRCSPAAEEEIAHVFSRVADRIVSEQPLLFGDFSKPNGYYEPKYKKV